MKGSKQDEYVPLGPSVLNQVTFYKWICIALGIISVFLIFTFVLIAKHGAPRPNDVIAHVDALTPLPLRFAAPFVTTRTFQRDRGTCWDFATVNLLETTYRRDGVARGFLKPEQFVAMSQQAYGISMIEACQHHPEVCDVAGDAVLMNVTDGGEIQWIYYLTELYNKVLPVSVCPYTEPGHDTECPGMEHALAKNPLKFDIKGMETAYSIMDTKKLMLQHKISLGWSSGVHAVTYAYACLGAWADHPKCNATNRVRCPEDKNYGTEWCAEFVEACYNMDGEFIMHGAMLAEGGHAMNVVGYNDEYITREGLVGGFIIKNSWEDRVYKEPRGPRGSHSIAYLLGEISDWDERMKCPNPNNPTNWLSCVALADGPTQSQGSKPSAKLQYAANDIQKTCLSDTWMSHIVNNSRQPTEFVCIDSAFCSTVPDTRYFLIEAKRDTMGDHMKAVMLEYPSMKNVETPMLSPPVLSLIFQPIASQQKLLSDDDDICGFYFFPYQVLQKQTGLYKMFFTTYLDIVWDSQSYVSQAANHPDLDYSLIKDSTVTQRSISFNGPMPWANQRF